MGAEANGGGAQRARWGSRLAFVLACVGSAIGLGNVWRFPWLSYKFGGGVFLVPYFLALLLLGLPLLVLELGVGRLFQAGDVEAFGRISPRLRGVGLISVLGSFFTVTYYVNIIAWSLVYFAGSFEDPMPWAGDPDKSKACQESSAFVEARDFLFNEVLRAADDDQLDAGKSHVISGSVYAGLVVTWVVIFFTLAFGVKGVSRVVAVTVPLPFLLLVVMLVYNATLEGARNGIDAYIGNWDFSDLGQKLIWPQAASQIFFSNGVGFGILTAYGSFTAEDSDLVADSTIIALSNSGVSILAGFVVYAIVGNVAHEYNCPNVDTVADSSGPTLAFVTYPAGMLSFPDGVSNLMSTIFFLTLFTLGIDSAFALVESLTTVLRDTARFRNTNPAHVTAYTCFVGFLISTLYSTDVGLALLDSVDHMLLTYLFLIIGLIKAVAISWIHGWDVMAKRVGAASANIYTVGYGLAVVSTVALASGLWDIMEEWKYLALAISYGLASFGFTTIVAFAARRHKGMALGQWWSNVVFAGTEAFRNHINEAARKHGKWTLHWVWDVIVKYIDPAILAGLIVNGVFNDATNTKSDFYNYPAWVQAVGVVVVVTLLIVFVALAAFPSLWTSFFGGDKAPTQVAKKSSAQRVASQGEQSQAAKAPFMTDSMLRS
ncbi:unnamed protein product [Ostreobium quekettii]|uniref:Sodium-dependent transporter n=1 Tax=Ostreobium quekettii TaxID=121088 RepID=A0A8S1ISF3_9CHLO|nr:unnamed protein product [Ostreobium quekettii]|eukprot:evm.model.scf_547EXC.5 EVM.evm.TU.scf_547EXC.5   scf_547EXC:55021-62968(-)